MSTSKLLLLNQEQLIPPYIRNLGGIEFSLQDYPFWNEYDESVRLYSHHFSENEDLVEVWYKGKTLVELLNGALKLYYLSYNRLDYFTELRPLEIVDVYGNAIYKPADIDKILRINPFENDGVEYDFSQEFKPRKHFLNDIMRLSSNFNDVFEILLFASLQYNFVNLYKLYETTKFYFKKELNLNLDKGIPSLQISKSKVGKFKNTANFTNHHVFDLLTLDIRHGRNNDNNLGGGMDLEEAKREVLGFALKYILERYKLVFHP
ncbi:hypothetical protein [Empedobacter tilapiae]|uniref:Uncharacterized protein n=1 Tax=Empedobacter tilapiae TaxID=2491114 RepID=A0A4Z1B5Q7_9FLAO|nr:hypothetical protein [Empedobacter tilapiae]TGN29183.1 hypothetical protein E4J94_04305 [Empedobacter tilapiae]